MNRSGLTRGWTAAAAFVAAALAVSLPASAVTQIRTATHPVGPASFDTLAVPSSAAVPAVAAPQVVAQEVAPPAPPPSALAAAPARPRRAARSAAAVVPAIASGATPGGGTWAFIVGINDYPGTANDLSAAVSDADEVERAMLALGAAADHVLTLRDGAATAQAVRAGLDWLASHAGPDAVAVFFYAGHVTKGAPDTEAIVATDGREIADGEVANRLAGMPARQAWIAIAGCYGGGFVEVLAPGRILTGAAPSDALAYENKSFARSYMVEYMVHQAIVQGKASSSVQAAFTYAVEALARDYPQRQPVQYDATDRPLDLRPRQEQAPPPPPEGGAASTPPTTAPPPEKCWMGFCN